MADDPLTIERLLGELQHRNRRHVLTFLTESDSGTVHIDELVEYIDIQQGETPAPDRLAILLHHTTLPALADAGFIDYDRETYTVKFWEDSRLERALRLIDEIREGTSCEC